MGQRSQIYIRHIDMNGNVQLVARYHQWDYGTRLVSRCKNLIDYIDTPYFMVKEYRSKDYAWDRENQTKLARMVDYNPDYNDIVLGIDLVEEAKLYGYDNVFGNDNNDGVLLLDVVNGKEIKYCFLDYCENYIGSAKDYLNWDCGDYGEEPNYDFFKDEGYKKEWNYTKKNLSFIEKNATLMTKEEAEEFLKYDYTSVIEKCNTIAVRLAKAEKKLIEMKKKYDDYDNALKALVKITDKYMEVANE